MFNPPPSFPDKYSRHCPVCNRPYEEPVEPMPQIEVNEIWKRVRELEKKVNGE